MNNPSNNRPGQNGQSQSPNKQAGPAKDPSRPLPDRDKEKK